jgi:hypothetical protein
VCGRARGRVLAGWAEGVNGSEGGGGVVEVSDGARGRVAECAALKPLALGGGRGGDEGGGGGAGGEGWGPGRGRRGGAGRGAGDEGRGGGGGRGRMGGEGGEVRGAGGGGGRFAVYFRAHC